MSNPIRGASAANPAPPVNSILYSSVLSLLPKPEDVEIVVEKAGDAVLGCSAIALAFLLSTLSQAVGIAMTSALGASLGYVIAPAAGPVVIQSLGGAPLITTTFDSVIAVYVGIVMSIFGFSAGAATGVISSENLFEYGSNKLHLTKGTTTYRVVENVSRFGVLGLIGHLITEPVVFASHYLIYAPIVALGNLVIKEITLDNLKRKILHKLPNLPEADRASALKGARFLLEASSPYKDKLAKAFKEHKFSYYDATSLYMALGIGPDTMDEVLTTMEALKDGSEEKKNLRAFVDLLIKKSLTTQKDYSQEEVIQNFTAMLRGLLLNPIDRNRVEKVVRSLVNGPNTSWQDYIYVVATSSAHIQPGSRGPIWFEKMSEDRRSDVKNECTKAEIIKPNMILYEKAAVKSNIALSELPSPDQIDVSTFESAASASMGCLVFGGALLLRIISTVLETTAYAVIGGVVCATAGGGAGMVFGPAGALLGVVFGGVIGAFLGAAGGFVSSVTRIPIFKDPKGEFIFSIGMGPSSSEVDSLVDFGCNFMSKNNEIDKKTMQLAHGGLLTVLALPFACLYNVGHFACYLPIVTVGGYIETELAVRRYTRELKLVDPDENLKVRDGLRHLVYSSSLSYEHKEKLKKSMIEKQVPIDSALMNTCEKCVDEKSLVAVQRLQKECVNIDQEKLDYIVESIKLHLPAIFSDNTPTNEVEVKIKEMLKYLLSVESLYPVSLYTLLSQLNVYESAYKQSGLNEDFISHMQKRVEATNRTDKSDIVKLLSFLKTPFSEKKMIADFATKIQKEGVISKQEITEVTITILQSASKREKVLLKENMENIETWSPQDLIFIADKVQRETQDESQKKLIEKFINRTKSFKKG